MNTLLYFEKSKKYSNYSPVLPSSGWIGKTDSSGNISTEIFNIDKSVRPYITLDGEGWDLSDDNLELWTGEVNAWRYGIYSVNESSKTETEEYYEYPFNTYINIPIANGYWDNGDRILSIIFKDNSVRSVNIQFVGISESYQTILDGRILTIELPKNDDITNVVVFFENAYYPETAVRISNIYFGRVIEFTDFANITENCTEYQYCNDLAISTLSAETTYNGYIDENKKDKAFLYIGSKLKSRYTVKTIKRTSELSYEIECEDIIGELDNIQYPGKICPEMVYSVSTDWYSRDVKYSTIVQELSTLTGITFILDDRYVNRVAVGFIKADTCRYALVQILFSLQARLRYDAVNNTGYIEPNTSKYILLYNDENTDMILGDATVEKKQGSSVELTYSTYTNPYRGIHFETESEKVYSGVNANGTTVRFDKPYMDCSVNPKSTSSWAIIFNQCSLQIVNSGQTSQSITVSSHPYIVSEQKVAFGDNSAETFASALLDDMDAGIVAKNLYNLTQYGDTVTASILGDIDVGQRVEIDTAYSGRYKGIVTATTKEYSGENIVSDITISNARGV